MNPPKPPNPPSKRPPKLHPSQIKDPKTHKYGRRRVGNKASPVEIVAPDPEPVKVDPSEPQPEILPDPAYTGLEAMLADLAGASSANVTVYRAVVNKPLRFVFKCHPDAFSLEELRDKYNGGDFRIYISQDGQLIRNMGVSIEPPIKAEVTDHPIPTADLAAVLKGEFDKQNTTLRDVILALRSTPQQTFDLPALITAATGAISALSQIARAPVLSAPAAEGLGAEKAIDLVMKGFEFGRDIAANADDSGPFAMIREALRVVPVVSDAVKSMAANNQRIQVPTDTVPSAQLGNAVAAATPTSSSASDTSLQKPKEEDVMRFYVRMMVNMARRDADTDFYARFILDNVSHATIEKYITRQDWFEEVCRMDPNAAPYRDWFADLREDLGTLLAQVRASQHLTNIAGDAMESPDVPGSDTESDPRSAS